MIVPITKYLNLLLKLQHRRIVQSQQWSRLTFSFPAENVNSEAKADIAPLAHRMAWCSRLWQDRMTHIGKSTYNNFSILHIHSVPSTAVISVNMQINTSNQCKYTYTAIISHINNVQVHMDCQCQCSSHHCSPHNITETICVTSKAPVTANDKRLHFTTAIFRQIHIKQGDSSEAKGKGSANPNTMIWLSAISTGSCISTMIQNHYQQLSKQKFHQNLFTNLWDIPILLCSLNASFHDNIGKMVPECQTSLGFATVMDAGRDVNVALKPRTLDWTGLVLPHSRGSKAKASDTFACHAVLSCAVPTHSVTDSLVQSLMSSVQRLRGLPRFLVPEL